MANDFKITISCPVCDGTGTRPVWQGSVDENGDFIPPGDQTCPECDSGRFEVGEITVPQLDSLIIKVDAIAVQVDALYEDLNP